MRPPPPPHTHTHTHSDGIDFLGQLPGLGTSCFVAMEAVTWVVDRVSGVNSRREAVKILQVY